MGYDTDFYGKLEFTRRLTPEELIALGEIMNGRPYHDAVGRMIGKVMFDGAGDETSDALFQQAEADRALERGGKGPLVFDPDAGADLVASMRNLITGEGLSSHYACHLRISDDKTGLVYCAEKTYDMIGGVNFIIVNAREKIPGFGLKGSLFASTEFEPYTWLVKINDEGLAHQQKCDWAALWDHDRKAYLQHLECQLRWRRRQAKREEDPRTTFRRAADSICERIERFANRCAYRWRRAKRSAQRLLYRPRSVPKF